MQQSHDASEAIRAKGETVLKARADSARDYLREEEEPEAPDCYPFVSVPEGTTVRDLPGGGRLLTLVDGAMVRVNADGAMVFIGHDGTVVSLHPAPGGIEGLPLDVNPMQVADGRYRVELPGGGRLDVSHPERTAVLGNPDGTVDVFAITRIEGIGEHIEVRPVPGGARGFTALESGHRGMVEADGTIHLGLANGLDLVIRFPEASGPDAGPGDPLTILCEERD